MAGELFYKESAGIVTLEDNGGALTTGSAAEADFAVFDLRAAGLANIRQNLDFQFELVCQWVTITGVLLGVVAAELYCVPALDGTNFPDVDLTGTTSALPMATYLGNFTLDKQAVTLTNMRIPSPVVRLRPFLYKPYILNRSGQTMSSGWTLKVFSSRFQYS